tara:strand:+ start:323 stop:673 length:351 start_codon:yes stop_codon:yes gene_type:complete
MTSNLYLKYNHRFLLNTVRSLIPNECQHYNRIKEMTQMFETVLQKEEWDKEKLYLLFMWIYSFDVVKKHILEYTQQHQKWINFIHNHLERITLQHINFKLNACEYVAECLNTFFII